MVRANGGSVSFEWPDNNDGWTHPVVETMLNRLGTHTATVHGCMVGVKSLRGVPIKKPWRIETTHQPLAESRNKCKCDDSHEHQRCEVQETRRSENYPPEFASKIFKGLEAPPQSAHLASEEQALTITKEESEA